MDQLHQTLLDKSSWYADWHKQKHHQKTQWLLLALVGLAFTGVLVNRIQDNKGTYGLQSRAAGNWITPQSQGRVLGAVTGEVLVKFKPGTASATMASVMASQGLTKKEELAHIGVHLLTFNGDRTPETVAEALSHNPNVEFAEPNSLVEPSSIPNDPWYANWQRNLRQIHGPEAWDITTGSSSVIAAVCDTGTQSTHEDLINKVIPGWNFYNNNSDTKDLSGHGTAVAGTVGAQTNNSTGVSSIGYDVKVMPNRVGDQSGNATASAVANCITWSADHAARVVNISYAMSNISTVSAAAAYLRGKNGVVTMSAGNSGATVSTNDPNILTIGAVDQNDVLSSYSDRGNVLDLMAPGDNFAPCFRNGTNSCTADGDGYSSVGGTSYAAPQAAGVAALVISVNPSLTASQIESILEQSADDFGSPGYDSSYGWGRVNAARAVACASTFTSTGTCPGGSGGGSDSQAPTVSLSAPIAGSTVSGTISISASASDNTAVAGVQFKLDGVNLGAEDAATPYSVSWNTTQASNGSHTLTAVARDAAGNSTTSTGVSVIVANTTSLAITSSQVSATANSVTISFTTNIATTASATVGNQTLTDANLSTSHTLTFNALSKSTQYNYLFTAQTQDNSQVSKSGKIRTKSR